MCKEAAIVWAIIPQFSRSNWRKPRNISVRIDGFPAEIRTGHLQAEPTWSARKKYVERSMNATNFLSLFALKIQLKIIYSLKHRFIVQIV
jgi:hypothetical protein